MERKGNRTVSNKLKIDRWRIDEILDYYFDNIIYVNRRYQRRLVWSLKEKQDLIDSIFENIPLPALLFVEYTEDDKDIETLEVIDGLQRINSIVSFVLGEYPVRYEEKYLYFDPSVYISTSASWEEHISNFVPKGELLPQTVCKNFLKYYLSVVCTGQDDETVDKIFSRLNSTGRKISSQDMRQAGVTNKFSMLVRNIASCIRHDITYDDKVLLSDMPKISLTKGKALPYGIKMQDLFWRRHDLITTEDLRSSRDEELIAALLISILLHRDFDKRKSVLDEAYCTGSKLWKELEKEVSKLNDFEMEDKFVKVFDTIDNIFSAVKSNFSSWLFKENRKTKGKTFGFSILFLAIYKLFTNGYELHSPAGAAKELQKVSSFLCIQGDKVDYKKLNEQIMILYDVLVKQFEKRVNVSSAEFEQELNSRLARSSIESQMFEYKIGISVIGSRLIKDKTIHRIAKSLVAMANTPNDEEGMIVIGIADSDDAYRDWRNCYKEAATVIKQHYVVGIEKEAESLGVNVDKYLALLREKLSKERISEPLKSFILGNFTQYDYYDKKLVVIKSKHFEEDSTYDGRIYRREGNESVPVK